MNLNPLIAAGVDLAFSLTAGSGVQRTGTYRRTRGASYDAATGVATPAVTSVAVAFLVGPYAEDDAPGDYQSGDERVVVKFATLRAVGVAEVETDDTLAEAGQPTRRVVSVKLDPTGQVLILQCRKGGV